MSKQDIDSRSGEVVNPGEPVAHVDMADGQSIGHSAEPGEAEPPKRGKPAKTTTNEPPPQKVSVSEIYDRAKTRRQTEIDGTLDAMDDDQKRQYQRMVAEAGGGDDPFAEPEEPAPAVTNGQAAPAEPSKSLDTTPEMVTVTIYGMQEAVPKADVDAAGGISNYQKNRAADVRLQRLTDYEKSLREYDHQLADRAARGKPGATPARSSSGEADLPPTGDPDSTVNELDLAKSFVKSMFSGDEEAAVKELSRSLASIREEARRAVPVSAPGQPAYASSQPSAEQAADLQRREANAVFANEFKELANSTVLRQAVLAEVQQVAAEPIMRGRPLAEITRYAATRVRESVYGEGRSNSEIQPSLINDSQSVKPASDLHTRMTLKSRTVVSPMQPAGGRFTPKDTSDEQPLPSNREYVNVLRKSRGQPPL
jgi:hypothetical protein